MIEKLLATKQESDVFDIKLNYYEEDKKSSLIKDIVSFANCRELGDKYIIFGVENKTFDIKGMSSELPDISEIHSLLNAYIEPSIEIEIGSQIIVGKEIKYIKIKNCINRPYVIKKPYSKNGKTELKEGEIYIRKNATNSIATRSDLIQMFAEKEKFSITINESVITSRFILLLLELKNETNNIIDITKMTLRILQNQQELVVCKSYLYNNNKKVKNKLCIDKENQLSIAMYSKRLEWVCFDIDYKIFEIISKNKDRKIYLNIKDDKLLKLDLNINI